MVDINTLVEEKLEADTTFQETLASLPEEEREQALSTRKQEVLEEEFNALATKAQEAEEAKELANNYKIRAEKAEKEKGKPTPMKTESRNLSPGDLLAVMNAKINEDDMDRVERFAISEGLSIREALKNPEMKAILDLREEQRNTAIATNVEGVRRGSVKITDDTLLHNASAGKMPDSDDDIERLIAAKMKYK